MTSVKNAAVLFVERGGRCGSSASSDFVFGRLRTDLLLCRRHIIPCRFPVILLNQTPPPFPTRYLTISTHALFRSYFLSILPPPLSSSTPMLFRCVFFRVFNFNHRMFADPVNATVAAGLVAEAPLKYEWKALNERNAQLQRAFSPDKGWRLLDGELQWDLFNFHDNAPLWH